MLKRTKSNCKNKKKKANVLKFDQTMQEKSTTTQGSHYGEFYATLEDNEQNTINATSKLADNRIAIKHHESKMLAASENYKKRKILHNNIECELLPFEEYENRQNHCNLIEFTPIKNLLNFIQDYNPIRRSGTKKKEDTEIINQYKSNEKIFGCYNCGCFTDETETFFCYTHRKVIYNVSTVEELLKYILPPFQQTTPLPEHIWREKYPIHLRKTDSIEILTLINHEMKILHHSPYQIATKQLFVCDICLKEHDDLNSYKRHLIKCNMINKGKLIYKEYQGKSILQVYQINGEKEREYCRRLCMLGKLFLDHKTLFYDVEPFLFYVLYLDNNFVGFFSKEKVSLYNLSCIVVLPVYQGKGFGYFLVDLSYKLVVKIGTVGTPEKPLSRQGLNVYKNYWMNSVYLELINRKDQISINEISLNTGMCVDDIIYGLELLDFIKYKKGVYTIEIIEKKLKNTRRIKPQCFF